MIDGRVLASRDVCSIVGVSIAWPVFDFIILLVPLITGFVVATTARLLTISGIGRLSIVSHSFHFF